MTMLFESTAGMKLRPTGVPPGTARSSGSVPFESILELSRTSAASPSALDRLQRDQETAVVREGIDVSGQEPRDQRPPDSADASDTAASDPSADGGDAVGQEASAREEDGSRDSRDRESGEHDGDQSAGVEAGPQDAAQENKEAAEDAVSEDALDAESQPAGAAEGSSLRLSGGEGTHESGGKNGTADGSARDFPGSPPSGSKEHDPAADNRAVAAAPQDSDSGEAERPLAAKQNAKQGGGQPDEVPRGAGKVQSDAAAADDSPNDKQHAGQNEESGRHAVTPSPSIRDPAASTPEDPTDLPVTDDKPTTAKAQVTAQEKEVERRGRSGRDRQDRWASPGGPVRPVRPIATQAASLATFPEARDVDARAADTGADEGAATPRDGTPRAEPSLLSPTSDIRSDSRQPLHLASRAPQDGGSARATLGGSDAGRFVQRVTRAVELAHQRGEALHIRLSPPELGSLRIEIAVRGGALTARLEADTGAARNALMDHLPVLRDRLAEQEIRIERFDVDVREEPNGRSQERSSAFQDQRRHPAESAAARRDAQSGEREEERDSPRRSTVHLVDAQLNLVV